MSDDSIYNEALEFHAAHPPGKISVALSKSLTNDHDLSLAYSPGVSAPCLEISKDEAAANLYTAKANFVAVITNGTAVLGHGNLGALASKPVMEGKCALFKRFACIDAVDIEVETRDVDEFITIVKNIANTWGGVNLEDIKAPECFEIEDRLKEECSVPIFHDDQHGTAIIVCAGLLNALDIAKKDISEVRVVINGAGAAGIACANLLLDVGLKRENVILCDSKGVIYAGREAGMNKWKEKYAVNTELRTLEDAMVDSDVFIGLSIKGVVKEHMLKSMAKDPIIFALANPEPEIMPDEALAIREDAIIATGRCDCPNTVNNVMGFPYIFRGALDTAAKTINTEMKLAAVHAIAELAHAEISDEVARAYPSRKMSYGRTYIIPTPFDDRLLHTVSVAVARAAMETGIARNEIKDLQAYRTQLIERRAASSS